jgi:hypothetical protein
LADSDRDARAICLRAMEVAADICVYTNKTFLVEVLEKKHPLPPAAAPAELAGQAVAEPKK